MHDEAGYRKRDERDKPGVQQLAHDQRTATFSQYLTRVDVLDAERNLRDSKVNEIDNGNENQQNGNGGQRDGNRLVGAGDTGPYIPLKMCIVQIADTESFPEFIGIFFVHIIA